MGLTAQSKVFIGWFVVVFGGLASFVGAREIIYNNRVEMLKSRSRIKQAIDADYEERRQKELNKAS